MDSPSLQRKTCPAMVNCPVPSRTVAIATPIDSCVPIASPAANAKSVTMTARFCARVLLAIYSCSAEIRPARDRTFSESIFFKTGICFPLSYTRPQSRMMRPSTEMVIVCQGMNFPLFFKAVTAACSIPPQQGTSMRTMVRLLTAFWRRISVNFSV